MITDQEGLFAACDRLAELRGMLQKISSDPKLNSRQRSTELAGVRGLAQEIEQEVRQYHIGQLQKRLNQLQARAATTSPAEMPEIVSQLIAAMQEFTQVMQPAV